MRNGGIGSAYAHAARHLAAQGHDVTICFVNESARRTAAMQAVTAQYAAQGIRFVPLPPRRNADSLLARVTAPTYTLLDWLQAQPRAFDIIHVSEWRGLGYAPMLVKSLGAGFGDTHFVVKCSSPTLWNAEGNGQFLQAEQDLGLVFMERRSVELADTVISGSAHMLDWMRRAGYALPARSFVWPNIFPAPADGAPAGALPVPLDEVVFFGRLEPRKGLILFVDAISRLARQGRAPSRITFLGGRARRFDGPGLIRKARAGWDAEVTVHTGFDSAQAVAYLRRTGRLAVMPSLLDNASIAVTECLQAGIPFVATATGGTPELVAEADAAEVLVAPDHIALGERIARCARDGLRPARPRVGFVDSLAVWDRWHAQEVRFAAARTAFATRHGVAAAARPRVSICITHFDRPALLAMALDSVRAQEWPDLEVVLVDDGSTLPESRAALAALAPDFAARGWVLIEQENRYLGAARNAAAAAATGEWLLFLDDDNLLKPDAVSRLVHAALMAGVDCLTAGGVRFRGTGDPRRSDAATGTPLRFLGPARAWNLYRNVVGDACALVRARAFAAVGGYGEAYRLGMDDVEFYNRLMEAGFRVEHHPGALFYYRLSPGGMKTRNRSAEQGRFRAASPVLLALPAEQRALVSHALRRRDGAQAPRPVRPAGLLVRVRAAAGRLWRNLQRGWRP